MIIERIKQCLIPLKNSNNELDSSIELERSNDDLNLKHAAVLIPLVLNPNKVQWEVLLTVRAEHLKHHPGQISFPGGGYEALDQCLSVTAIRETNEEIGIAPNDITLLGKLPRQKTISLYDVTPFVGVIDPQYHICIDTNEVTQVFKVPLAHLIDINNQVKVTENINGENHTIYKIQYKHYNIWGATARILVNLTKRINHNTNVINDSSLSNKI